LVFTMSSECVNIPSQSNFDLFFIDVDADLDEAAESMEVDCSDRSTPNISNLSDLIDLPDISDSASDKMPDPSILFGLPADPPPPSSCPIPTPAIDGQYNSVDEAVQAVKDFAARNHFAVIEKGSTKYSNTREKRATYIYCDLGKKRKSESKGNRKTSTDDISAYPTLRRQRLLAKDDEIRSKFKAGLSVRQIRDYLHYKDPGCGIKLKDLYNFKLRLNKEFLAGRIPIQALLTTVKDSGKWLMEYHQDLDGRVTDLFCMHKQSLRLLAKQPYILLMDCTYKTNRYKMPLLNITGITATNRTFFIGFAFISSETRTSFGRVIHWMKSIYKRLHTKWNGKEEVTAPETVIIDKDRALINAIQVLWPQTKILLCIWHINKNILSKAKPLISQALLKDRELDQADTNAFKERLDKDWKKMLKQWYKVVSAASITEYETEWVRFKDAYQADHWARLIQYINLSEIEQGFQDNEVKQPQQLHGHVIFREVLNRVSSYALYKTYAIFTRYLPEDKPNKPAIKDKIKSCTGITLKLTDFHHQWHLRKDPLPRDPRLGVRDPVVVKGKGRPSGSKKRDPSEFERMEKALDKEITNRAKKAKKEPPSQPTLPAPDLIIISSDDEVTGGQVNSEVDIDSDSDYKSALEELHLITAAHGSEETSRLIIQREEGFMVTRGCIAGS
ncbi:hypothetical protein EYZ11_012337, partial [Aspergillus tanneri]